MIRRGAYVVGAPWSPVAHLYTGAVPVDGGRLPGKSLCGARTTSLRVLADTAVADGRRPCRTCATVTFARSTYARRADFITAYERLQPRDLWLAAWWARTPAEVDRITAATFVTHPTAMRTMTGPDGNTLYTLLPQRRAAAVLANRTPEQVADDEAAKEQRALEVDQELEMQRRDRGAEWREKRDAKLDIWSGFGLSRTG